MATASSFMKGFSEAYLADLGRIIAAWSHIEQQFDMLFLSLSGQIERINQNA